MTRARRGKVLAAREGGREELGGLSGGREGFGSRAGSEGGVAACSTRGASGAAPFSASEGSSVPAAGPGVSETTGLDTGGSRLTIRSQYTKVAAPARASTSRETAGPIHQAAPADRRRRRAGRGESTSSWKLANGDTSSTGSA